MRSTYLASYQLDIESRIRWRIQGGMGHMPPRHVGKRPECTKSRHFQTRNRKYFLGGGNAPSEDP